MTRLEICCNCDKDCSGHHWWCDDPDAGGPWCPDCWEKTACSQGVHGDGLGVSSFGRGTIAVCPTPQQGGVMECVANARLIAAAPDMLAALNIALHDYTLNDSAARVVEAAIAKAVE